jgi:hypothetical protein
MSVYAGVPNEVACVFSTVCADYGIKRIHTIINLMDTLIGAMGYIERLSALFCVAWVYLVLFVWYVGEESVHGETTAR